MKLLPAVALCTWMLLGCQDPAPPIDTRVHLLLTDAPVDEPEVTKVLVTFTRVGVSSEAEGAWTKVIDYGPSGRTFDLLTLRGGITAAASPRSWARSSSRRGPTTRSAWS